MILGLGISLRIIMKHGKTLTSPLIEIILLDVGISVTWTATIAIAITTFLSWVGGCTAVGLCRTVLIDLRIDV